VAVQLAHAFFQRPSTRPSSRPSLIAVVGEEPEEVRTSAWLLSSIFEADKGVEKSGLLSDRRTLLGQTAIDVGRPFTPCTVQELLAGMAEAGVEVSVVEILPGTQDDAFDGVEFDLVVDLGSSAQSDASSWKLRKNILQQSKAQSVVSAAPQGHASSTPGDPGGPWSFSVVLPELGDGKLASRDGKQLAAALEELQLPSTNKTQDAERLRVALRLPDDHQFSFKATLEGEPSSLTNEQKELGKLTKAQLTEELTKLGLAVDKKHLKPQLVEQLREAKDLSGSSLSLDEDTESLSLDEDTDISNTDVSNTEEQAASAPAARITPVPAGVLRGRVLPGTDHCHGLHLVLELCEKDVLDGSASEVTLTLPLLGAAGAKCATVAACAALAFATQEQKPANLELLSKTLKTLGPSPGALELLTPTGPRDGSDAPSVVGVLHEASSPAEVRRALQQLRAWLSLGNWKKLPELTVVFGCQGEVGRGDRAKYGWALAEFCDRVVLTSQQPRAEPAMQVLEDVLEALHSRALASGTGTDVPLVPVREVHVVADRTDAVKLAACCSVSKPDGPPGLVVVFGSGFNDYQEAAGQDGSVRRWLCNDRRLLLESLDLAEMLNDSKNTKDDGGAEEDSDRSTVGRLNTRKVPWSFEPKVKAASIKKACISLPGQSLHWTYRFDVTNNGVVRQE